MSGFGGSELLSQFDSTIHVGFRCPSSTTNVHQFSFCVLVGDSSFLCLFNELNSFDIPKNPILATRNPPPIEAVLQAWVFSINNGGVSDELNEIGVKLLA